MDVSLRDVIVENFKSYEGRVRIGPLPKFICIVGPNGAGKSNLVEAISFVLGVQARHLRGERMQDLVHKKPTDKSEAAGRTTSVEVTFSVAPSAEPTAQELVKFQRSLLSSGEAQVRFNGDVVSMEEYHQHLERLNILSKAKNFLIFQGDIQAAASKEGKDLTLFLEQVSGSFAYKAEYERLAAERSQKEEVLRGLMTKKRLAANEKKRLSQQDEEASAYEALRKERSKLLLEYFLYRLYCLDCRAHDAQEARELAEREAAEGEEQLGGLQRSLAEAEHERAAMHLATSKAERSLSSSRARLDRLAPENAATHETGILSQQQLAHLRSLSETDVNVREKLAAEAARLQRSLAEVETQLVQASERAQQEHPLSRAQQQRYEDARKEALRLASATALQLQALEASSRELVEKRDALTSDLQSLMGRRERLQRRVSEIISSREAAEKVVAQGSKGADERSAQAQMQRDKQQDLSKQKETLLTERQGILRAIQDITATERQLQRERHLKEVSADIANLVPGVEGRVIELCQPSRRDLSVAISVALGGSVDAIIVDTAATGRQCIRFLKERMLDAMTFLPLHDLRGPPADHRLQAALRNRASLRSALSCLTFQERHSAVFNFLLGDVVIADTLDDGRQFAYGEMRPAGIRCRVVTLEGEQISRDGNLSISSGVAREGATRFDFQALSDTQSRLDALDRRLLEIHSLEMSTGANSRAAEDEARRLEERVSEASRQLSQSKDELSSRQEEMLGLQEPLDRLGKELEDLREHKERLQKERQEVEESLAQATKSQFEALSAELGVEDVQKLEREWRQNRDAARADEAALSHRLGSIKADLRMVEQTQKERGKGRSIPQEIAALEQKIANLRDEEAGRKDEVESLQKQVSELSVEVKDALQKERATERVASQRRQEVKQVQLRLAGLTKRLAELKAQESAMRQEQQDVLRESLVEDVDLPFTSDEPPAALMDAPGSGLAGQGASHAGAAASQAADDAPSVDFALLPEDKRAVCRGPAVAMLEEEYRDGLKRIAAEVERRAPNMKAAAQLSGAEQAVKTATESVQTALKEMQATEAQFEEVRTARRETFIKCFRKVAAEISGIYRQLTSNSAGPGTDGGSAFLDLEDTEDPFLGGVKFTVMPPLKRYVDIAQLSGGERALSAMALLFAVQSYQRPPVLVLDEVDAPLDASNVECLAQYLQKAPCQTIVISLKERLYKCGDGLLGVSKDRHSSSSVLLSVDLRRFRGRR